MRNYETGEIKSPAILRVYDSEGNVLGPVNGEIINDILNSDYYEDSFLIVLPMNCYYYDILGTDEGTYGLAANIVENETVTNFTAFSIPTLMNATHRYTINWTVLSQGEKGVTISIDESGDGIFEYNITTDYTFQFPVANFTYSPVNPIISQTIIFNASSSFDPDGNITSYEWDFGDYNVSYDSNPTHQYTSPGNYTVCLDVTDDDGATDDICKQLTVIEILNDVNQSTFDRGFPIRHALDGDWATAQSFIPTLNTITSTEIYMRKFGTPEFNLTVELRENHPQGTLLDTLTFLPGEVPSSWEWFSLDFADTPITPETDYFIVIPPAPSGVTTSFGYEWGYAFGNQYNDGAFWFTRDGGGLWRDLPTMYEFVFRTYGYT